MRWSLDGIIASSRHIDQRRQIMLIQRALKVFLFILVGWALGLAAVHGVRDGVALLQPVTATVIGVSILILTLILALAVKRFGMRWRIPKLGEIRITRFRARITAGAVGLALYFFFIAAFGMRNGILVGSPSLSSDSDSTFVLTVPVVNSADFPALTDRLVVASTIRANSICFPSPADWIALDIVDTGTVSVFTPDLIRGRIHFRNANGPFREIGSGTVQLSGNRRMQCRDRQMVIEVPLGRVVPAKNGVVIQLRFPRVLRMVESESSFQARLVHVKSITGDSATLAAFRRGNHGVLADSATMADYLNPKRWEGSVDIVDSLQEGEFRGVHSFINVSIFTSTGQASASMASAVDEM
jgi:hypothetical protein